MALRTSPRRTRWRPGRVRGRPSSHAAHIRGGFSVCASALFLSINHELTRYIVTGRQRVPDGFAIRSRPGGHPTRVALARPAPRVARSSGAAGALELPGEADRAPAGGLALVEAVGVRRGSSALSSSRWVAPRSRAQSLAAIEQLLPHPLRAVLRADRQVLDPAARAEADGVQCRGTRCRGRAARRGARRPGRRPTGPRSRPRSRRAPARGPSAAAPTPAARRATRTCRAPSRTSSGTRLADLRHRRSGYPCDARSEPPR